MAECDAANWRHEAAGRGAVRLELLVEGLLEQCQIVVGKSGLLSELGVDEAVASVQTVRYVELAPDGPPYLHPSHS